MGFAFRRLKAPGSCLLLKATYNVSQPKDTHVCKGFPDSSVGKESTCNAGNPSSIPGSGRSTGEGIGYPLPLFLGFPCGSAGKESASNVGNLGLIPGLGRSPGEGKGYPLQYSGLENSMDCIVHAVAKSWIQLNDFHFHFSLKKICI